MSKHTPGPWIVVDRKAGAIQSIQAQNKMLIGVVYADYQNMKTYSCSEHEAIANARLIAAAPELLAALELIVSDHEFTGDNYGERRDAWIETARAAIAKAKGEK